MSDLIDRFKEVMERASVSELEMSWSMGCAPGEFKAIMNREKIMTDRQENVILRIILKQTINFDPLI